jgi:hypothetical protein
MDVSTNFTEKLIYQTTWHDIKEDSNLKDFTIYCTYQFMIKSEIQFHAVL